MMIKQKKELCLNQNKKCKDCKVSYCKNRLERTEEYQQLEKRNRLEQIIKQLPSKCKECNIYKITDDKKEKVYCPYMIGNLCILK